MAASLERQMATSTPVVQTPAPAQSAPPPPLPPPPQQEGMIKEVQLPHILKLKPPSFTGEYANEDLQRFLDGVEKDCMALGCSIIQRMELATYQLDGKVEEWWNTWRRSRAHDAPPIDWEEFGTTFM